MLNLPNAFHGNFTRFYACKYFRYTVFSMYKGLHGEGGLRDGHMWQNPMQPWWLHVIVRSCCITYIHTYTVYATCGVLTDAHAHTCVHQYRSCSTYVHMCTYVCTPQASTLQQCSKEALDAGTHSMANLSLEYWGLWIMSGSTSIWRGRPLK